MKFLRLAGASLNQTPLAFAQNKQNILDAIAMAREQKVDILCLPELALSGYGCEDAFFNEYVLEKSLVGLKAVIEASAGMTISVGLPLKYAHVIYNTVALIHDEQLLGFVAKQDLAGDGIYYEPRWFKPWPDNEVGAVELWGESFPVGDILIEVGGVRMGVEICEDAWNGIRPAQDHYIHNVDIILNPSASNFAFGKSLIRERLVTEASRSYNCTYVYSNLVGNDAGRIIFDGEVLISQGGELLARNERFDMREVDVLSTVVDVESVHIHRKKSFNFRPEEAPFLVEVPYQWTEQEPQADKPITPQLESKEEEFYLAETLALWDYMRKSYSRGFVLSLSGGADSSCCAVLCAEAINRASKVLGEERIKEVLAYAQLDWNRPIVEQLLTCVYQATANSGDETEESARELAKGLGATYHYWEVEAIHQQYIGLAEQAIGRPLTWEKDDITLQNIQARLRSPGIWMLANINKALLITTSNRSEAAVGYATMDGDTSGGLAPLAGMDKASLLSWLGWAERQLPVPALSYVNSLQPTAELRPEEYDQTDEADLMPYGILDAIEKCAIRDYQSPVEVFRRLKGSYPDQQLKAYIKKFFLLWSRNQWKRERYAPSFHLDDENLDPKTWCRFPILNGGFRDALQELEQM